MIACIYILLLSKIVMSQVVLVPSGQLVSVLGGTALFRCIRTTTTLIESVEWLLNGTLLDNDESDISQNFDDFGIGDLMFNNLPLEYRTTTIQCRALLSDGETVMPASTDLIVLEGLLSAVGSLMGIAEGSTISLTWTAPSTQEDIDADPVINGYCVDVATSLSTIPLLCGITETMFSFPIPPDVGCDNYTFTVTPVSPGGNGTQAEVQIKDPCFTEMTTFSSSVNLSSTQISTTLQGDAGQDISFLGLGFGLLAVILVMATAIIISVVILAKVYVYKTKE